MTTPKVTRAMSAALRNSIQSHVTGLFVRSRWCTRPLATPSSTGMARNSMSPGYQKPGRWASRKTPASQMNQRLRTETPAAYRTTSGPDRAPGATQCRRASTPALSKPRLPVPSRLPGCALTLQTERLRLQPRNPAALPLTTYIHCRGTARARCINPNRKSDRSTVSKRERPIFPFSPSETPEGHA